MNLTYDPTGHLTSIDAPGTRLVRTHGQGKGSGWRLSLAQDDGTQVQVYISGRVYQVEEWKGAVE